MPKYTVKLRETTFYEVEVEAENEADAEEVAEDAFVQGEATFVSCEDRHACSVEELT